MLTIPLKAGAVNAHLTSTTTLGDESFTLVQNYVTPMGRGAWSLDVWLDDARVKSGMMLEPNSIYKLGGSYGRLAFVGDEATLDNLGIANSLVWISDDE